MHHLERYTSPEWPARESHNRRSALMPLGHESVPGTLCIQNVLATAHQTAGATLGRATDRSPIKMHNLERYTGLEWHDHAKTAAAFYTRA